jgi:polysaccharide biosynthesis/export protein
MRKHVKHFLASLFVLLFVCSASQAQSIQERPGTATAESNAAEYVIGLEDILSVNIWKEPDLSLKEVVVRPDGKISLPLINDIRAGGLTLKQLQDEITGKLKEFVASPMVSVSVLKVVSQSVTVAGQVNRPGSYPLGSPITVVEILARAGGLTEFAKAKSITVLRVENGQTLQFPVNYKDVIKGKNLKQNIKLKKGDVILVP